MHSFNFGLVASIALVASAVACGAATQEPATPPAATAATPAPASSADAAPSVWSASMPKEAQMAYMKKNVAPRMAKVFQTASATHYADFGCKSCHGPEYKVPKDYLPRLSMKDGKITAFAEKPEVAKFMAEHVVPEMASAMGQPPYDPQTQQGFGCAGCHGIDMK